jgi:hypothetical protein
MTRRRLAAVAALFAGLVTVAAAIVVAVEAFPHSSCCCWRVAWLSAWPAAKIAFAVRVPLPRAARPRRPVLFVNLRSGGGNAERFSLAAQARARGIDPLRDRPRAPTSGRS